MLTKYCASYLKKILTIARNRVSFRKRYISEADSHLVSNVEAFWAFAMFFFIVSNKLALFFDGFLSFLHIF